MTSGYSLPSAGSLILVVFAAEGLFRRSPDAVCDGEAESSAGAHGTARHYVSTRDTDSAGYEGRDSAEYRNGAVLNTRDAKDSAQTVPQPSPSPLRDFLPVTEFFVPRWCHQSPPTPPPECLQPPTPQLTPTKILIIF